MINPFDKNFFHFFFGFISILFLSFAVLFFTGKYGHLIDEKNTATVQEKPLRTK